MTVNFDLIVIGEGIAGLTCAAEAAKLGIKVATFEAEFFGGLVMNVNELQNFDEAQGLSGMDYAASLATSNVKAGVTRVQAAVHEVRREGEDFAVHTDANTQSARAVVIATGARLKRLGVRGEEEFEGRGVSRCADCDAPMFSGADVVVVGGNEWAIHEAMVLAADASKVYLVHEGVQLTAGAEAIEHMKAEKKIESVAGATVTEILGDDRGVTGVRVRDGDGNTHEIACAGVFPIVGLEPNSKLAPAGAERDAAGYLRVDASLQTAVPNLWAIGNVRAGFGGWLTDAVEDARRAVQAVGAALK